MVRKGLILSLVSVVSLGWGFFPSGSSLPATPSGRLAEAPVRIGGAYGKLPLSFEANRGQADQGIRFLSRDGPYVFLLRSTDVGIVLSVPSKTPKDILERERVSLPRPDSLAPAVLSLRFAGANPAPRVNGLQELPGKAHYFIGNDPAKWLRNIPTYARVQYEGIYPGVDLSFYGNHGAFEYDFVVRPGADPSKIALEFEGAKKLHLSAEGDLVLQTRNGTIVQQKPTIYQEINGVRQEISGGYLLTGMHQVGFRVGAYDTHRPLVIDPAIATLAYSTYLGFYTGAGIAVDGSGNAYVTGIGTAGVLVAKLSPDGSTLVYSTYIGGTSGQYTFGIAVDSGGNAYVTGFTSSTDFPTTPGAFQTFFGGGDVDAFVTKLNSDGSALSYSTYLGGAGRDVGYGISLNGSGNARVIGYTNSTNFPTANAFQATFGGGDFDAFVTAFNPDGTGLIYSTYLGGDGRDIGYGIAVDGSGNAYMTGSTTSSNFPTTLGAFQVVSPSCCSAFVTKLDPNGSPVYSTYLGGNADGLGIAADSSGNAYVTGSASLGFPTTPGAFQTTSSSLDAFVTKLNPTGSVLVYSTYLGGAAGGPDGAGDIGRAITVDSGGNAYVTGSTRSTDFPTTLGAIQTTCMACPRQAPDAFVTAFNSDGSGLVYSTYLGGSGSTYGHRGDYGSGIAVDSSGGVYVAGTTNSSDFPTTPGAFRTSYGGGDGFDAFVTKFTLEQSPDSCLPILPVCVTPPSLPPPPPLPSLP